MTTANAGQTGSGACTIASLRQTTRPFALAAVRHDFQVRDQKGQALGREVDGHRADLRGGCCPNGRAAADQDYIGCPRRSSLRACRLPALPLVALVRLASLGGSVGHHCCRNALVYCSVAPAPVSCLPLWRDVISIGVSRQRAGPSRAVFMDGRRGKCLDRRRRHAGRSISCRALTRSAEGPAGESPVNVWPSTEKSKRSCDT